MAYVFKEITGIKPQFFNHFDTNRESLGYDTKFAKPLLLSMGSITRVMAHKMLNLNCMNTNYMQFSKHVAFTIKLKLKY